MKEAFDGAQKIIGVVTQQNKFIPNPNYLGGNIAIFDKYGSPIGIVNGTVVSSTMAVYQSIAGIVYLVILGAIIGYFPHYTAYRAGRYGWKILGCFEIMFSFIVITWCTIFWSVVTLSPLYMLYFRTDEFWQLAPPIPNGISTEEALLGVHAFPLIIPIYFMGLFALYILGRLLRGK